MDGGLMASVVSITFTALSGLFLAARCVSRFLIRKFGADDISAILAWLSSLTVTVTISLQYKHGFGQNIDQVAPTELFMMLKYLWASLIAYALGMTLLKVSALLQYLRFLFKRTYRIFCWCLLAACALYGFAASMATIFSCRPIGFSWSESLHGQCINQILLWHFAAIFNVVTDVMVVVTPIIAVKNMTMPPAQKRALIVVFALGGFGCIVSILRIPSIHMAATSHNITKDSVTVAWWSSVEMNVGVICISLPPLKALIARIAPQLVGEERKHTLEEHEPPRELHAFESNISSTFCTSECANKKPSMDPVEIP